VLELCHACLFHDSVIVKEAAPAVLPTGAKRVLSVQHEDIDRKGSVSLVEVRRFELLTPCLQSTCSTN
jgi:hypothetical protein